MRIKKLIQCPEIIAGDKTLLRELLHPDRDYEFDGRYSLAHATVSKGQTTLKHRLSTDEVYYILSGKGLMFVDEDSSEVESGDSIEIPAGAVQSIQNIGDSNLNFLCIVDPAWQAENETIIE